MDSVLINDLIDPTPGEREFVQIINEIAENNTELSLRLYYEPEGSGCYPDFALYSNYHGIILFEIKDHSITAVEEFHPQYAKLNYDKGVKSIKFNRTKSIEWHSEFQEANVAIPVSELYVFPNLTAYDLQYEYHIDTTANNNQFILSDDLDNDEVFLNKIKYHSQKYLKFYRPDRRTEEVALCKITREIGSPVISKSPEGLLQTSMLDDILKNERKEDTLIVLSKQQESFYRKFLNRKGFRFLKGHAGTGKTLLLIAQAEFLAQRISNVQIFITYFTSQLDGIFHHLQSKYPQNITVERMGQFCSRKIRQKTNKENWDDYFEDCLNLMMKNSSLHKKYDFIFVDEGQDFRPSIGKMVELLAKGEDFKTKNVVVAFDDFQALNNKSKVDTTETFKGKQRGRVKKLDTSYRTPIEIAERAEKLIGEKIESFRSVPSAFNHHRLGQNETISDFINDVVKRIKKSPSYNIDFRDMAIIYPHHGHLHDLADEEVRTITPIQKYTPKSSKTITKEKNTIKFFSSTYCKGLDFKVVFLIMFDEIPKKGNEAINKKPNEHLYVSLTRSLEYVFVITKQDSELIDIIVK
jgi:superfamily I DNA and RNA helicase